MKTMSVVLDILANHFRTERRDDAKEHLVYRD